MSVDFSRLNDDPLPPLQSLVIVTRLPFVELFQRVSSLLAPEFFEKGSVCLEASAKEIDQWPSPIPGPTLHLPLMGTLFQVRAFSGKISVHLTTVNLPW